MTQALCLNCGEMKFGALCPCPSCEAASTGDMAVDIAFSDHHLAVETLKEFGEVVRAIRRACDDGQTRLLSFLSYVSAHHADVLQVDLPPELAGRCAEVLTLAHPPPVLMRESEGARMLREIQARTDDS